MSETNCWKCHQPIASGEGDGQMYASNPPKFAHLKCPDMSETKENCPECGHPYKSHREKPRQGCFEPCDRPFGCRCARTYESLVEEKAKAVCDEMSAQLDNPISPSGRYGLSSLINDSKPFTGIAPEKLIFHDAKPEPTLLLLIIDLGDSCVVKVEKGDTLWEIAAFGKLVPEGSNMWPIIHVPHTFTELRAAIDGEKPVPRIEEESGGGWRLRFDVGGTQTTYIGPIAREALEFLFGKPLPIYNGGGNWTELSEYEVGGTRIWRYSR